MRRKCPVHLQVAPAGLFTIDELETQGLRVRRAERPVGLLKVKCPAYERTCGLFRLDQCEPLPVESG